MSGLTLAILLSYEFIYNIFSVITLDIKYFIKSHDTHISLLIKLKHIVYYDSILLL